MGKANNDNRQGKTQGHTLTGNNLKNKVAEIVTNDIHDLAEETTGEDIYSTRGEMTRSKQVCSGVISRIQNRCEASNRNEQVQN